MDLLPPDDDDNYVKGGIAADKSSSKKKKKKKKESSKQPAKQSNKAVAADASTLEKKDNAAATANKSKQKKKSNRKSTMDSSNSRPSSKPAAKTSKPDPATAAAAANANKAKGHVAGSKPPPPETKEKKPSKVAINNKRKANNKDDESSSDEENMIITKKKKDPPKKKKSKSSSRDNNIIKPTTSDYDSDSFLSSDYDSDSDPNKKKSSRRLVEPTSMPSLDSIGDEGEGEMSLWVLSLIGEYLLFTVKGSDTIDMVRKLYWDLHSEWGGSPNEMINFICHRTNYFISNDKSLSDWGIEHGSILLLVVGNELEHTGGFLLPSNSATPPSPHPNMYRVSDRYQAPSPTAATTTAPAAAAAPSPTAATTTAPAAAAAAAAPTPTEPTMAASNPPPDEPPVRTEPYSVPGFLDIHAILNSRDGTVRVNGNTISHDASLGVTYMVRQNLPPEYLRALGTVETQLQQEQEGSVDKSGLPSRFRSVKIGQAKNIGNAMGKIKGIRSQCPYAHLTGVFIVHGDGPRKVEKALHVGNALKRGGSSGEHFAEYTQLDQHLFVESGRLYSKVSWLYFSTNGFPRGHFDDIVFADEEKGVIYKVSPDWSKSDELILKASIRNHSLEEAHFPFQYQAGADKANFRDLSNRYLNAHKFGRFSGTEGELPAYFQNKILWANGSFFGIKFTFVKTSETKRMERMLHIELKSLGRWTGRGEWYFPPEASAQLSNRLNTLISTPDSRMNRAFLDIKVTYSEFHEWVRNKYMSFKIIWECVKEGAIILIRQDERKKWKNAKQGERDFGEIPPEIHDEVKLYLLERSFGPRADNVLITTELDKDMHEATNMKYFSVKTATSEFRRPELPDAERDFVAVFGQVIFNEVSGGE